MVATVGAVALRAVCLLVGASYKLGDVVGTVIDLPDFWLVPLYHPSPRVLNTTRSFDAQKADFESLRDTMCSL